MRGYSNSRGRGRGGKAAPVYQEPQVQYAFPHMNMKEILEDMVLFDNPLSEADLKSPKPEFVHDVFSFFLKEIFADGLPSRLNPVPECLEVMEYPSIHEESPAIFHFMRAVFEMLWLAQYSDFNMHDLIAPTGSRFRWQLSAMLNLAKFKQSRLHIYDALASGEDDCVAQRDGLLAKIEKQDADIANIEGQREVEAPQVEEFKRLIPELVAQFEDFRKQKLDLTEKTTEQKAEFASLSEKLTNLKEQVANIKKDITEKQSKVVTSPDRALAQISSMEEKVRKSRENTKELVKKKAEKQARANAVQAATESLKLALKAQQECIARLERKKEVEAQLQKSMVRKAELEQAMRRDEENLNILQKSMESMQGRRSRQKQLQEDLHNQMEQDADVLEKKRKEADRHSEEVERKVEEHMTRENELKAKTIALSKQFAKEMTEMMNQHEAMLEQSDKHSFQLHQIMDIFATENKKAIEDVRSIQQP